MKTSAEIVHQEELLLTVHDCSDERPSRFDRGSLKGLSLFLLLLMKANS